MSGGVVLVMQVSGVLSNLIMAGALALIALRSGLSVGGAVAYGLGFLLLSWLVPFGIQSVGMRVGLPMEAVMLVYPVCWLLASLLILSLALRRWPRPQ